MVTWGGAFAPDFLTVSPPQLDPRVRSLDQAPARHVGRAIYTASLSLGRGNAGWMRVGADGREVAAVYRTACAKTRRGNVRMHDWTGKVVATVSALALLTAPAFASAAVADGVTLTRTCENIEDPQCAVQLVQGAEAAAVTRGPTTGFGPAIELNLAVSQLADAGTASGEFGHAAQSGTTTSSGAATNSFNVATGQTGTATATSGNAATTQAGAQASSSSATQNPPSANSGGSNGDPGADPTQSPPGGGASGINMITNVASTVQIVQVVARNNSNTTIAPVQVSQLCQQAAVSCTGAPSGGN